MTASLRLAPLLLILAGLAALAVLVLIPWVVQAQSRDSGSDFILDAANGYPTGIWSDETTLWVADFEDHKPYAYRMSDRSRDSGRDFTLDTANGSPVGIWSDGTTMWASDFAAGKLYAYRMSDRSRDSGKDFNTLSAAGNKFPEGIWSDGTTMWVADTGRDMLFAYNAATMARDADKDFTLDLENDLPVGIWSDGYTMWVVDWRDAKLYAYRMSDRSRDAGKDFALDADDQSTEGLWSVGATMWVASRDDDKLYAYDWNNPATGAPTITGAVRVDETLAADITGIADADGLTNVSYSYRWIRSDGTTDTDIAGETNSTYTLVTAEQGRTIKVRVSFTDDANNQETLTSEATAAVEETCPRDGPAPVAVTVTAVPIAVESTTDEYFVLYARQRPGADTTWEIPVSVTLGSSGTTTLTENVAALPLDHYRVEKYLVADPADVDVDCIDDITELADPVAMNPVNPAAAIDPAAGGVIIADRQAFESLSFKGDHGSIDRRLVGLEAVKFYLIGMKTDRPAVYFMNTKTYHRHSAFESAIALGSNPLYKQGVVAGEIAYHPSAVAPDGSLGVYRYQLKSRDQSFEAIAYAYTLLAASMPLLDDNLAHYPMWADTRRIYNTERALYDGSRVNVLLPEDVFWELDFIYLNTGDAFGFLRTMTLDERPNPRDIVIYETLPNELPHVAGIITTVPQTPLSHVNLRAIQDGVPNAFIRRALEDTNIGQLDDVSKLVGRYVHYIVFQNWYTIRPVSPAEVDERYASSRPPQAQTPERDLSFRSVTPLSDVDFEDWRAFGVKAANVAVLGSLDLPENTVPDGFAVPFYFYDEFMKHNGFYEDIDQMLANPGFQSSYDTQDSQLKKLRKKIKDGDTPGWITQALEEMHAAFPQGTSLRYRSSTNNEDLPGFSGAGLYDSKTQHPNETVEDGISKSLKQVYASLWNFRAFTEREFHRIDHRAAAMGVLVHPNFSDELANGVAVSFDPIRNRYDSHYVNTQVGEDLVTNPEAHSVPEEILLQEGGGHAVLATSNQLPVGQLIMSDGQMTQLRSHLEMIHERFADLYCISSGEQFAMEIEFKITSDNILSIKQARPWVFSASAGSEPTPAISNTPAQCAPVIMGVAQVGQPLTVSTSSIRDADGMTSASFGYQWVSNDATSDTDIVGATDSTYTLSADDEGKTIKVRVSFADDAANQETLTSTATTAVTRPNSPATGAPTISGTARVDETLTADITGIADEDGLNNVSYSYQWIRNGGGTDADIAGETASTYTLSADDEGKTIKVEVSFTDDAANQETLTSAETTTVTRPNSPATGAPTISGTAQAGETLTADISGIADEDGLTTPVFTYQWVAGGADISGATSSSQTLTASQQGQTIRVRVSFTDDAGNQESLTSEAAAAAPRSVEIVEDEAAPLWSADMLVVEYTSVSIGAASADLFSHVWGSAGLQIKSLWSFTPDRDLRLEFQEAVPGAADLSLQVGDLALAFPAGSSGQSSFRWTDVDVDWEDGQTISVRIVHTSAVAARPNSPATGQPTISGTAQVGETLTADTSGIADTDGLTNVSYSYQWLADDANIDGATGSTYILVNSDEGKAIKVRVSFTDDADHEETLTSAATGVVAAKPNSPATGAPTIDGTAQVGETLTALTNGITDEDGLSNVSYSYQWIRNDGTNDADIAGQTASTYRLVSADVGKTIKVRVSFTDDANNNETLTSAATAAVAARPNSPATGLPTIIGTAQVGETLSADTSAIADMDGLTNVSYSYQWIRNDGNTDSDIESATSTTYNLVTADQGKTIKVRVSFTDRGGYQETLTSAATIAVAARTSSDIVIVDVPGTVSLWPELPRVGTVVRATLTDPDGLEGAGSGAAASLGAVSWQWARSSEGSTWTSVDAYADGDSYTPTEDDEGMWLKVTAVYTDGHGQGKSAEAITAATVGAREASPELTVTELVTGLTHPWDIAFTPDGTMLFTERDDGLRVRLTDGTVRQVTADFSDLNFGGTAGLLALVLDPDFVSNRRFYTYQRHTGAEMQLIAWTIDEDYTTATRVADPLVGGIPRNRNRGPSHGGGRLRFGPQGYLWVATGDGYSGTAAQDLSSLGGKVLRVDPQTGAGAPDNPFAPSPVYTYGHRNPQGLALRPGTGQMWSVEHGPNHDDEINLLVSGGNYGWDPAPGEGAEDLYDETTTPMTDLVKFPDGLEAKWSSGYPTLAVGGGVFLEGSQWREWEGQFAVATLKTRSVRVFKFTEEGDLVSQVVVPELDRTYGRLRTAVLGPDGALYITTTNGGGKDKILKVVPANTPATGVPSISGTAQVDETLTVLTNGITDADGLDNVSYTYQWIRSDGNTDTDIQNATSTTYMVSDDDAGKTIRVRVSFTDDRGNEETLTGAATIAVQPRPNSPATGVPTISGAAQVDQTLTVSTSSITDADGLTNVSYSYQWIRNDGTNDADIGGQTGSTYTLTDEDVGKSIKVRVSFTDDADHEETLTSAATDTVAATKPGVPGLLNVFPHDTGALDVYWEAPASDGGSAITGYKVQWKESADSWDTASAVSEETASGTTHSITGLTDGVEYSVRVMAVNYVGDSPPSAEKPGTPRETQAPQMVRPRVDGPTLRVLYDEALDAGSAPPADSFDVRVACTCDDTTWLDEEAKRAVENVSVDGDTVVLTLVSAATSEDVVVVSYTPPSDAATARTRDLAGNAAAGFNSTEVFNDTDETAESEENGEPEETTEGETPLTVSLEATTQSHNGTDAFTFEIRFSEEFPLSYKTLRDLAFTVSGGEVLKAQRVDRPSNIRWLITVEPDSNGDVAVVLPVTQNCASDGAICTGDGRKLSTRLELTVSGPGQ